MTAPILRAHAAGPGGAVPLGQPGAAAITASVVSHAQGSAVRVLLELLADTCGGHLAQVVVTHNLPEPPCGDPGRAWPFELVERFNATPLGFGANHNQAFAACDTAAFAVLNPDLHWSASPWRALLDALAAPQAGLAYPDMRCPDGRAQDHVRAWPTPAALVRRHALRRADAGTDWVSAACWLVRREAWLAIGGFDEAYFMYCEDVDFCLRLRAAGWRLAPAAVPVVHEGARRSRRDLRHLRWHLASLWRLWHSAAWRARAQVCGRAVPPG